MNDFDSVSPVMREMLAVHEGFRKLGFKPEDIFAHYNPDGSVLMVLHVNDREFGVFCGNVDLTREGFYREWERVVEAVTGGSMPQADCDRIWKESVLYQHRQSFVAAIVVKGIEIPVTHGVSP